MDIITIGGLVAVVAVVVGACFTIYKLLSRETTFEEIYGNDNVKSLNAEKSKKAKRIHSKWRQSPKKEADPKEVHNSEDDEVSGGSVKQKNSIVEELPLDSELNDELKHLRIENEKLRVDNSVKTKQHVVFEKTIKNKIAETKQLGDENKKLLSKNEQFCAQLEKQIEELEYLRNENAKLRQEKNEQSERHVIFEQTVKSKLIETHKLGDENKKLRLKCDQFCEQLEKQQAEVKKFQEERELIVKEMLKLREDRDLAKSIADNVANDVHSKDLLMRNMETSFEHQNQALQLEFNKERVHFKKLEQDWLTANGMLEQMTKELSNTKELVRELEYNKSKIEHNLNEEQKARNDSLAQVEQLKIEINRVSELYNNLQTKFEVVHAEDEKLHSVNNALKAELINFQTKNQSMQSSVTELEQLKITISELNTKLDCQRSRNQELRDANYKLLDTVKVLQTSKQLNGTSAITNGDIAGNHLGVDSAELIQQLTSENNQYKSTLDSLNKQLEQVSKMAMEVEFEKDSKIAQFEKMLLESKS